MRIALHLMTRKGLAVLDAALAAAADLSHVVTAPATGMADDSHTLIALNCKRAGIPVFSHAAPPSYQADVTIAAGWRWLLEVPELVVLHDSLLPRYRGFAPLVTALVNGEPEVGVTAFLAREEPDTGPIVAQRSIPVSYPARVGEVIERLLPLYAELATAICEEASRGPLRAAEQDHSRATYSLWRDELDYRIDWTQDDRRICRLIDAVGDPFPGAVTWLGTEALRVSGARSVPDLRIEDRHPGKILRLAPEGPVVVCGTGLVQLTDVRYGTVGMVTGPAGQSPVLPAREARAFQITTLKQRFA